MNSMATAEATMFTMSASDRRTEHEEHCDPDCLGRTDERHALDDETALGVEDVPQCEEGAINRDVPECESHQERAVRYAQHGGEDGRQQPHRTKQEAVGEQRQSQPSGCDRSVAFRLLGHQLAGSLGDPETADQLNRHKQRIDDPVCAERRRPQPTREHHRHEVGADH
jgi:hypothetical protein